MTKKLNVLVFPCGSENASEIHDALRYSLHVHLVGLSSTRDHGEFLYENYIGNAPNIKEQRFDEYFLALVKEKDIDLIFATHDSVAEYLAPICENIGVYLVNGDLEATKVARSKKLTYSLFAGREWMPQQFSSIDEIGSSWPVVVKPDFGQGGQGVHVCTDKAIAATAISATANPLIVEYLPGIELTVDCFTDRYRNIIWVGPRTRERVRAGITMRSEWFPPDEAILQIAKVINTQVSMRGPWFFQIKKDKSGNWKLLEISCRIAGTMVFQRAKGVNLPLMAVHDFLGRDLKAMSNPHINLIDRRISTVACLSFEYENVYMDLDDTLIIDGHAVPMMIAFLFQARSKGKLLCLITRHDFDPVESLREACVDPELFDEIIHIRDKSLKSLHVRPNSIFIDNHFPERLDVFNQSGIPVFDLDAIQFLIR